MSTISPFHIERAMSAAQQFAAQLRVDDPEIDDDDLLLALDSETDVMDMLRRVVRAALDAEVFADAIAVRAKCLAERKARFDRRATSARALAMAMMEALDLQKFEDPEFTLSIGKPRTKVIVTDETALPDEYWRVTRTPNMAAISTATKDGHMPPGVEMANGAPSLTIRSR